MKLKRRRYNNTKKTTEVNDIQYNEKKIIHR